MKTRIRRFISTGIHQGAPRVCPKHVRIALVLLVLLSAAGVASAQVAPRNGIRSEAFAIPAREQVNVHDFFGSYGRKLGLGPDDQMVITRTGTNPISELDFVSYAQVHARVPVIGAGVTLSHRNGLVVSVLSHVVPDLSISEVAALAPEDALAGAERAVAERIGMRPGEVRWSTDRAAELLIQPAGRFGHQPARLVYRCRLGVAGGQGVHWVHVDAVTGKVLSATGDTVEWWAPDLASGQSLFDGVVDFECEADGADHRLQTKVVRTRSMVNASPGDWHAVVAQVGSAVDIESDTGFFGASAAPGVTAHWAATTAAEMFRSLFGTDVRKGGLGELGIIDVLVDVPLNGKGVAFFHDRNPFALFIGHSNGSMGDVDVVGHEMGHLLLGQANYMPGPDDYGETGSVRESFADIMGVLLEAKMLGFTDWVSAARVSFPEAILKWRDLQYPILSTVPQPEVYHDGYWADTTPVNSSTDWGGVHTNSGVQNRWFFLFSQGGTGTNSVGTPYEVDGIGLEPAARVLFSCHKILSPGADYLQTRDCTVQAAVDLCGEFSQERISAHQAWAATGLYSTPPPAPFIEPAESATNVDPWDLKLMFEVGGESPGWLVELSPDPAFESQVVKLSTESVAEVSGITVATASVSLEPEQEYYWRVRRAAAADDFECWRPAHRFSTGERRVDLIAPQFKEHALIHPWELCFEWEEDPLACSYTLQVSTEQDFSTLVFPEIETSDTDTVLDVYVNENHYWRVRPNTNDLDGSVIRGTWTTGTFETSMPEVNPLAPAPDQQVYPWPVFLQWAPVTGVDHYVLELKLARSGWGDPDGILHQVQLESSVTQYQLSVAANDYWLYYSWRVRPVGPEIGPPMVQQEGLPGQSLFRVRGADTKATPLTTFKNTCARIGEATELEWTSVPRATLYRVQIVEAHCPPEALCRPGPVMASHEVRATVSGIEKMSMVPLPMGHNHAVGFYYLVQAFGPGDAPGFVPSQDLPVPVQPTVPEPVAPTEGATVESDQTVQLQWLSQMAHWGGFVINVYKGSGAPCTQADWKSFSKTLNSNGGSSISLSNLQIDGLNHSHSWKVRPWVLKFSTADGHEYQPCAEPQWSECRSFRVLEQAPDLAPPWVEDETGGIAGFIVTMWGNVRGADHYLLEVREGSPSGPQFEPIYEFSTVFLEAFHETGCNAYGFTCPPIAKLFHIMFLEGAAPDLHYFYRVKACQQQHCSQWSDWGETWDSYWP